MSGFLSWFGGSAAKQRKDSPREAILLLRGQRDMLMKRADHLLSQISTEEDSARTFVASNKILAKQALVRKKGHEKVLEQTHAQIATLDQQITAIESANINVSTLEAMQKAAKAMEVIHDKLTPQKVDETMDRLRDQNDLSNEIMNAISSNPLGHDVDETELEEELEELEQERLNDQMLKTGQVPVSDVVHKAAYRAPTTSRPTVQEDPDEAELRKLEAEMQLV